MADLKLFTAPYDKCKRELVNFRNENRTDDRDAAYFDWRYTARPLAGMPIIVWAESEQGRRVGSLSMASHQYLINGRLCPVGILGDISVSKESRERRLRYPGRLAGAAALHGDAHVLAARLD